MLLALFSSFKEVMNLLPLTLKSRRSGMEEGYENPDLLTVFQDGGDNAGTLGNSNSEGPCIKVSWFEGQCSFHHVLLKSK